MGKFVYAVARGHQVGIYNDWNQCKAQIDGFKGARFKKFSTIQEAEQFINVNSGEVGPVQTPGTARSSALLGKRKSPTSSQNVPEKKVKPTPPDLPIVYTDGACSSNGTKRAKAGWGVYWGPNHKDNCCGPVSGIATNNRGELEAVKIALDQAISKGFSAIVLRTDSKLLINSLDIWIDGWKKNGWKTSAKQPVKNVDLLTAIDNQRKQIKVYFEHVAAHVGIEGNEAADELARRGASQYEYKD